MPLSQTSQAPEKEKQLSCFILHSDVHLREDEHWKSQAYAVFCGVLLSLLL